MHPQHSPALRRYNPLAPQPPALASSVEQALTDYFACLNGLTPADGLYERILHEVERPLITRVLCFTRGNQVRAAEILGINRNTLRKKIQQLDIDVATVCGKNS